MQIRVLYSEGCPNARLTFEIVRRLARDHGVETPVATVEVRSGAAATSLRFLGSPTVQINGVDIEPAARDRTDFALACRLYRTSGVPDADMIAAAIREASA